MGRTWSGIVIAAVGGFILLILAFQDMRTPSAVTWEPAQVQGLAMERADKLVLQEEKDGILFASDGFSIYRSEGERGFLKVHTVSPPFGIVTAAHSRALRNAFGYQEAIEVVPLRQDLLLVFVGGEIHRVDLRSGKTEVVHRLRYFGYDEGRGVMPFGITVDDAGRIYYGEYMTRRLEKGETVALFRSDDEGRSFRIVYEFPALKVRHIHAVQWDPFDQVLWMGTGDGDEQSRVGFSRDQGKTFIWVGEGTQDFRTVNFVFGQDGVDWLSDTKEIPARAFRWRREDWAILSSERSLPSHGLYMQDIGDGYRLGTTAEETAGLWLIGPDLTMHPMLDWPVGEAKAMAFPTIRLARGAEARSERVHLSPLRVEGEDGAIYRLPRAAVFAKAGVPVPVDRPLLSRDDR